MNWLNIVRQSPVVLCVAISSLAAGCGQSPGTPSNFANAAFGDRISAASYGPNGMPVFAGSTSEQPAPTTQGTSLPGLTTNPPAGAP